MNNTARPFNRPVRLILILMALTPGLVGCQIGRSAIQTWEMTSQTAAVLLSKRSDTSIERELVDAISMATTGFRFGGSPQAVLVLERSEGARHYWVSSDGFSVVTEYGRIIRTSGFTSNLTGSITTSRDPFQLPHKGEWAASRTDRLLDFSEDLGFSNRMTCTFTDEGVESIEILGSRFDARVVEEKCRVSSLRWKFSNTYWLDTQTGFIWRSSQWISPALKRPIVLEVLRPSATDPNWTTHLKEKSMKRALATGH